MTDTAATESKARKGFRRKLVGTVTSDKMDKTVTVEVVRRYLAPLYKKYVRSRQRYHAHDAKNEFRVGDRVEISESRPLSKTKRWVVTRLIAMSADRER
ncbi:MAG: 30S ribosomal protein S17 [Deltaproteobacteria bacterium]|jgi:small subunit ribosomal protein S17|nr:30S ribosomal protein S17 [Deltaproteobacteria bacterium]MBW2529924.1 30S ribosomal protein S17 [Deltaproteobacteria bacterium]